MAYELQASSRGSLLRVSEKRRFSWFTVYIVVLFVPFGFFTPSPGDHLTLLLAAVLPDVGPLLCVCAEVDMLL